MRLLYNIYAYRMSSHEGLSDGKFVPRKLSTRRLIIRRLSFRMLSSRRVFHRRLSSTRLSLGKYCHRRLGGRPMRGILSLKVYELASSHLGHHCRITVEDEHGAISKPVPSSATNCRD